jgi:valyl-tRNA synthetase
MLKIITEIRKYKTDKQIKLGSELPIVNIKLEKEKEMLLSPFLDDLKFTIKANKILFQNENNEIETNHPIIAI